jgi:hypothetical protein
VLHFYDGQIRRYLTQLIRMVSNFTYKDGDGDLRRIPVMYGDITRQVANILKDNSENKLPSAPRIALYITGLDIDRERTSDSSFVSKVHVRERAWDANNNEYLNMQGKNYTVERLMPTPYKLTVNADIWSTNTDQKLQILEQILMLFNPSLEIQTTDNYIDWASLTTVDLEAVTFSNRSIPVGTNDNIDVATLTFTTPIWISPPAKVKKMGIITDIIMNIFNEDTGTIDLGLSTPELNRYDDSQAGRVDYARGSLTETTNNIPGSPNDTKVLIGESYKTRDGRDVRIYAVDGGSPKPIHGSYWDSDTQLWVMASWDSHGKYDITSEDPGILDLVSLTSQRTNTLTETPTTAEVVAVNYQQYGVYVEGNEVQLIKNGSTKKHSWINIFNSYPGRYVPGITRIFLSRLDLDILITGTVTLKNTDNSKIIVDWDSDTFPSNTDISGRTSIDFVIDPARFNPVYVKQSGSRFLLIGDIGSSENQDGPKAWKQATGDDFLASENDIIEWDGNNWSIVFDSSERTDPVFTTNLNTRVQYMWTGSEWIESINGDYPTGSWRIELDG